MGQIVTVDFHGDRLVGFEEGGAVVVALKPIVEAMNLDWSGQLQRVKRDPILSKGVVMMPIPFGRGGAQEAVCLGLNLLHGWLFTVDTSRIPAPEVKARVLLYQRECYQVLAEHFQGGQRAAMAHSSRDESLTARRQLVAEARQTFGTVPARELWFALNLPVTPSMTVGDPQGEFRFTYTAIPEKGA
ncbi:phage antirepressor N-terminal domain-containing protein [Xanthobacter sediminis]